MAAPTPISVLYGILAQHTHFEERFPILETDPVAFRRALAKGFRRTEASPARDLTLRSQFCGICVHR
jgi:hypothetical protein